MKELNESQLDTVSGGEVYCTPWLELNGQNAVRACVEGDIRTGTVKFYLEGVYNDLGDFANAVVNEAYALANELAETFSGAMDWVENMFSEIGSFFENLFNPSGKDPLPDNPTPGGAN